jgi:hypothetical protein
LQHAYKICRAAIANSCNSGELVLNREPPLITNHPILFLIELYSQYANDTPLSDPDTSDLQLFERQSSHAIQIGFGNGFESNCKNKKFPKTLFWLRKTKISLLKYCVCAVIITYSGYLTLCEPIGKCPFK